MEIDLSIVIVSYNTKRLTINCILSIYKHISKSLNYEIIVIDNNSSDGSFEEIQKKYPRVICIRNESNLGFAKANNIGFGKANGKYLLLLNSDVEVLKDSFSPLLKWLDINTKYGVLSIKTLNEDLTLQWTCFNNPNFITEIMQFTKNIIIKTWDPFTYYKYMKYWDHNKIREVKCVSGCFMVIRSILVKEIGGFNENYFMYYEDADFCRKIYTRSKYKIVYYPQESVIHFHGKSEDKLNSRTLLHAFNSSVKYIKDYYGSKTAKMYVNICKIIWFLQKAILIMIFDKSWKNSKIDILNNLLTNKKYKNLF